MLDKASNQLMQQFRAQAPDLHDLDVTIEDSRTGARALFLGLAGEIMTDCDVQELHIPGSQGQIPARLYTPLRKEPPLAVVVFFHGGGWCLADLDCYDGLMRELCSLSGCALLSVEYRLAPENKFPAGLTDCCDAVHWIKQHAPQYNLNPSKISLMGDSAGGNLALVSANVLTNQGINLQHLYLIYPVVDSAADHKKYPSRIKYGDGDYFLTRDAISDTRDWYLHNPEEATNPLVSPLLADEFSHLPPTSIMLAGCDPLYDEGIALAQRLKHAGVLSRLTTYEQTIHAFLSFGILPVSLEARKTLAIQLAHDH